jgi:hypothetical protein
MKRALAVMVVLAIGSSTVEAAWQVCAALFEGGSPHACCAGDLERADGPARLDCCTVAPRDERGPVEVRYRPTSPQHAAGVAPPRAVSMFRRVEPLAISSRAEAVSFSVPLYVRQLSLLI